ncbi:hypothetical protein E4T66_19965 [Sinimarinibacterium sp. CAU 1509]|uniref:hypothetical protein n=1 Tax=Sinimarinibacterium sp. CAU 1509 TaxID=2562283 RepID=UPI0010AB8BC6|nr:hypothetical protein [Sinimarinibacterium sp. CAU 1509]TJY56239.1 hypothetical protein E4T66_19965 [Sinimarinibacterium sp. CAU 1509]
MNLQPGLPCGTQSEVTPRSSLSHRLDRHHLKPALSDGFLALDSTHGDLDDLFATHQEQIIAQDFRLAARLLNHYRERLFLHMRQEEAHLLPLYSHRRGRRERSGTPAAEIYYAEHRKLRELIDRVSHDFTFLLRPQPSRLQIVAMIERESQFKRVLEHHGERERSELYVELNRLTAAAERDALVALCLSEWRDGGA